MRIHSDILTPANIHMAELKSGTMSYVLTKHGSRKRKGAFEVKLSGRSNRKTQDNLEQAATWDQWGIFINHLFEIDPNATMTYYADAETFHAITRYRFETLTLDESHNNHKWEYNGIMQACKCGAGLDYRYAQKAA